MADIARRPRTIAFVLVSYVPDAPAGMERATAALIAGLRLRGHRALVMTAADQPEPDPQVLHLTSLRLTMPCDDDTLRREIQTVGDDLAAELVTILDHHEVDVVVYVDALWGLGRVAVACRARNVLAMHVVGHDEDLAPALARTARVIAPSPAVLTEAADRGYDTGGWVVVPNGLLFEPAGRTARCPSWREALRIAGPIQAIGRLGGTKNMPALIRAAAGGTRRTVEVVLAAAGFEDAAGSQANERDLCQSFAAGSPHIALDHKPMPWQEVPRWLGGAAVVIVPSLRESFGLVALEAMSVGTPVVAFTVGNLPALVGEGPGAGGLLVPSTEGPEALVAMAESLLSDPVRYGDLSRAAYYRSRDYLPTTIADAFLEVVP